MTAAQYIDHLASVGRYHFTTTEAAEALGISCPPDARPTPHRLA